MIDKLAEHIMVPLEQYPCIPETLTLRDAIMEMVNQNVGLLPVLKDGSVVGVVRSVDVLSEIALILSS